MARRLKVRDFGTSLNFASAANNNVDCGTDFLGTGDITICAWIKPRSVGETAAKIVDNGAVSFALDLAANNKVKISRNNSTFFGSSTNSLEYNKWSHWVATSTSAGVSNIYKNGALSSSANGSAGTPIAATTNVIIGSNAATIRDFDGWIDEVRIFNRVLTSTEIADLYYDGTLPSDSATSQIAAYDMNGTSSTTLSDITGNGHDGTITGATRSPDVPMRRRFTNQARTKCIDFVSGTDSVDCGSTDFLGTGNITVSGWLKPRGLGGSNLGRILYNNKFDWTMTSTNTIRLSSNKSTYVSASTNAIVFNQWTHVIITRDSSGGATFYINGQVSGTAGASSGTPAAGNTNVFIGNEVGLARAFNGSIQDIRVHNRILTQAEINDLYFDGVSPSGTLVRQFTFDNTLADATGQGADGVATGTTYSDDVRFKSRSTASNRLAVRDSGTALRAASASSVVVPGITITLNQQITYSTFFKMHSDTAIVLLISSHIDNDNEFAIGYRNTSGLLEGAFHSTAGYTNGFKTTTKIQKNKWYHFVYTFNGTSRKIYINGVDDGALNSNIGGAPGGTGLVLFQRADLTNNAAFLGVMDSTRIWNRALTAQEVSDMYYNNIVPSSGLIGEYLFNEGSGTTALDTSGNGNNGTITGATYTTDVFMKARTYV